jgi:ATP-dependent helicase/nuclease subunit B
VSARPRKLSASAVEYLMRDPYIIYAKHILRLKPLDELEPDLTMADYGNIIHGILDNFNKRYSTEFPENAKEELLKIGHEYFVKNNIAFETRAFWWPRFEKIVDWLVAAERGYRKTVDKVYSEIEGSIRFDAPAGEFEITAKADRVDELKNGRVAVIDYKTGQIRSQKEVKSGYAPQLPIEGIIAANGGFTPIGKREVEKLIYWGLGNKDLVIDEEVKDILESNLQNIKDLVALFDFETTPYMARPNPSKLPKYSDYDHLARVKEWSVSEEGGNE